MINDGAINNSVTYNEFKQADDENVKLTGNQTISGLKTFTELLNLESANNQIYLLNSNYPDYWGFLRASNSGFVIGSKNSSQWLQYLVFTDEKITAPTPAINDNSTQIATTGWCYNAGSQGFLMGVPNYSATVTVSNTGTYTAPSNGYLFITVNGGGTWISLTINGVEVAYGWYTNTGVGYRASIPMSKGNVITWPSDRIKGTTIFVSAK